MESLQHENTDITCSSDPDMLVSNLMLVKEKMQNTRLKYNRSDDISLVAVSKTKPSSDISVLYQAGQRKFGENYFQV